MALTNRRRTSFIIAMASSMAVASCTTILGVQDLERETGDASLPAGSGGGGGGPSSGGTAGAMSSGMGGTITSNGGSTVAGGSQGGSGGSAGNAVGSGGSANDAGTDGAGGAGMGGQPDSGSRDAKVDADVGPLTITVTGTLIDVLRRPYAGVPVAIGNVVTSTDAQGRFQVSNVTPPYDVALRVSEPLTYGWYFVGLTIPSPVLQVSTEARPARDQLYLTMNIANPPPNFPPANEYVGYSWGSQDGWFSKQVTGPQDIQLPSWTGPVMTVGAAHVLAWTMDAASLPTTYVGYDTTSVTLNEGATSEFSLDLTKTHPGTAALSGTFTLGALGTPHIDAYVALPKNASIKIASEDRLTSNRSFSYNVPTGVTGASVMVCAQAGSSITWPFSLAHKHGLSAGQTAVALTVPDPATLGVPGNNAVVSTSTDFSWTAPGPSGSPLYILGFELGDVRPYTHVRIVTSKTTARIPKFPVALGPIVAASVGGVWWVETTGPYVSVDAAATASGFVGPFDYSASVIGPLDQDGTHAWSATRNLMISATP
jgi:hypothetical protein